MDKTIFNAAQQGDLITVQECLQNDPGLVDAKDEHDCTPLHYSAIAGHTNMAELLINHGAQVDPLDKWGQTPLFVGVYEEPLVLIEDRLKLLKTLLSNGANIRCSNKDGASVLHVADDPELVNFLLVNGADVNAQDFEGDTPLHKAIRVGNKEVIGALIAWKGIGSNIKNNRGQTPCQVAEDMGWSELAKLLQIRCEK